MSDYRDYGYIGGAGNSVPNVPVDTIKRGQVYQATHLNDLYTDYMYRSFISFSYGGRNIEEFNLIAVTNGDRMNHAGYAPFDDITTTYDNLDGQQYWNTHYKAGELELLLSTDGIDQRMLEDFLHWFVPGEAKELILAEHPNRAILARVADPPQINMLPFKHQVEVKISNYSYPTYTTLYKGDITLKFVMDQPHWYALDNVLGIKEDNRYIDRWINPNGESVSIFASQDALKILYEDGIPLGSMIQNDMLLGNGAYAKVEDNVISHIWSLPEEQIEWSGGEWGQGDPTGEGARIEANNATFPYTKGVIAGAIMDASGNGITYLPPQTDAYFYYSGTAPAPTIISFTMTPYLNGVNYITEPCNKKSARSHKYNIITIESEHTQQLCFTTPNIFTSYNMALQIFDNYIKSGTTYSWEDICQHIRDEVRHVKVREWAMYCIETMKSSHAQPNSLSICHDLKVAMSNMLYTTDQNNNTPVLEPCTFTFNSETGEATGIFHFREAVKDAQGIYTINYSVESVENVGDMLRSNYIILRDRNTPDEKGYIKKWTNTHKRYSHRIRHDITQGMTNLTILYKNMYL